MPTALDENNLLIALFHRLAILAQEVEISRVVVGDTLLHQVITARAQTDENWQMFRGHPVYKDSFKLDDFLVQIQGNNIIDWSGYGCNRVLGPAVLEAFAKGCYEELNQPEQEGVDELALQLFEAI